ncbi:MAG: SMC family ATPase [Trueperaceae bacterium]
MKPIRLTLEAFGPYLERQVVAFDAFAPYGLFLIHGPTGSGKSTLLDAIVYALFDARSVERGGAEFVSTLDVGAETAVSFEFEHHGVHYRVSRRPAQSRRKQRGDGLTQVPPEAELVDVTHGDVIATRTSDVTRAIEELLHTNVEQFRQTVLLPQGEFRKVVTDHATRRAVLSRVFRTERFTRLTDRIRQKAKDLETESAQAMQRRSELLESAEVDDATAMRAKVAAALEERGACTQMRTESDVGRTTARTSLDVGQRVHQSIADRDALRERRAKLRDQEEGMAADKARLAAADRAERVHDRREAHRRAQAAVAGAREEATSAARSLADAEQALANANERLATELAREPDRSAANEAVRALELLAPQLADLRTRQQERVEAQSRLEEGERTRTEGAARRRSMQEELATLQRERDALEAVRATEADLVKRQVGLQARAGALTAIARQQSVIDGAERQLADAEIEPLDGERWLVGLRERAAGLLAGELADEAPCPVCGSRHHPAPHAATFVDDVAHFFDEHREASGRAAAIVARIEHAQEALEELRAAQGWEPGALPDAAQVGAQLHEVEERLAEVAGAKERLVQLGPDIERLEQESAQASTADGESETRIAVLRAKAADLEHQVAALEARVEPDLRHEGAYEVRLEAANERVRVLDTALESARTVVGEARELRGQADERHVVLGGKVTEAVERAEVAEREFHERLAAEGFGDEATLDDAALVEKEREELRRRVVAFDEERARVEAELAAKERELDGMEAPDLEALRAALDQAETAWRTADEAHTIAVSEHERLTRIEDELGRVAARYADIEARVNAAKKLRDLAAGQVRGRARIDLETYVLQSIVASVLSIANRHLARMTDGRYALHLVDREDVASSRGLELEVADNFSGGERRPVHTLSGGEGFLASLALALGLSESAQRTSGAGELGALFIDEGFGSLDARSLDTVVDVLRTLPTDGRLVGIITHVDEMKRRIPAQLLVEPAEVGSRFVVRIDA